MVRALFDFRTARKGGRIQVLEHGRVENPFVLKLSENGPEPASTAWPYPGDKTPEVRSNVSLRSSQVRLDVLDHACEESLSVLFAASNEGCEIGVVLLCSSCEPLDCRSRLRFRLLTSKESAASEGG